MKKSAVLTLAALLAGCGRDYDLQQTQAQVMGVTPSGHVQRSVSAHSSSGSYTFLFEWSLDGKQQQGCVYRSGSDVERSNRALELEAARWERAYETKTPVYFETSRRTPEGCYVIDRMRD